MMIKEGTPLILYMGLKNIDTIIEQLLSHGVDPKTKIAAVSKVSYVDESILEGDLTNFGQKVRETTLPTPTVLMIGNNVDSLIIRNQRFLSKNLMNNKV